MLRTPLILGLAVICVACTTNPYTHERQASNKGKGAAIGAAVGAVLGVATGDDADERRKRALSDSYNRVRVSNEVGVFFCPALW